MRIATITCHDVYNYGASLQAYALQSYCEQQGVSYTIIDYKPPYLSGHYSLMAINNPVFNKPLVRWLYRFAKLPGRLIMRRKKKRFDAFTYDYLRLTPRRYASCAELKADCPKADLYIAGSDQIWNTLFPNGADAAFYLDFVDNKGRKISYAASFATDKIKAGKESFVRDQLKNFDAISVRESSGLELLKTLGQDKGMLVCDPVFLLSDQQWKALPFSPVVDIRQPYILVYDCERSGVLKACVRELQQQTGLSVYSLSPLKGGYEQKYYGMGGPLEFVTLMANADYVLTNSFHATAFSLIFHKNFFVVNRSEGINTRMQDFLSLLGLTDRLISGPDKVTTTAIDFSEVSEVLSELIGNSKAFIELQMQQIS